MKNLYSLSRLIMSALTIILSLFVFTYENMEEKLIATLTLFTIVVVISFITSPLSKLIIKIGDKIKNIILKIIYYIALIPILGILAFGLWMIILNFYDSPYPIVGLITMIGKIMEALFFLLIAIIIFAIPYIQTLLVLLLRTWDKSEKYIEKEEDDELID